MKLFEKLYQARPFFFGRNHDFSSRRPHNNFLKIWNLKFLTTRYRLARAARKIIDFTSFYKEFLNTLARAAREIFA